MVLSSTDSPKLTRTALLGWVAAATKEPNELMTDHALKCFEEMRELQSLSRVNIQNLVRHIRNRELLEIVGGSTILAVIVEQFITACITGRLGSVGFSLYTIFKVVQVTRTHFINFYREQIRSKRESAIEDMTVAYNGLADSLKAKLDQKLEQEADFSSFRGKTEPLLTHIATLKVKLEATDIPPERAFEIVRLLETVLKEISQQKIQKIKHNFKY